MPEADVINVPVVKGKEVIALDLGKLSDEAYRHIMELGAKAYVNSRMSKITKLELGDEDTVKREAMLKAQENLDKLYAGEFRKAGGAKAGKVSGAVKTEAMRLARNLVKDGIKSQGGKISHYDAAEITAAAKAWLEQDESILAQAKENVEARAKLGEAGKTALATITGTLKVNPKRVAEAEERKAKAKAGTISAKQAGMTAKAKTKGQPTA